MLDAYTLKDDSARPHRFSGKGFGRRAVAYVLDMIFVSLANIVIGAIVALVFAVLLAISAEIIGFEYRFLEITPRALEFVLGIISMIAYFALFEALFGATLGKVLLRMRVVALDGSLPDFLAALSRGAWRLLDGLLFGLFAALTMKPPLQQRYGDKRAKTVVVASNSPEINARPSAWRLILAASIYALVSVFIQIIVILAILRIEAP